MRTGPFKSTSIWQVYEHDGTPVQGMSSQVKIVRASEQRISYRHKDRTDPQGMRRHQGNVADWGYGVYRVAVGHLHYIEAQAEPEPAFAPAEPDMWAYHQRVQARAEREDLALGRRRTMAAWRIQRFLRDTTCNPVYAAARRSLERLCLM